MKKILLIASLIPSILFAIPTDDYQLLLHNGLSTPLMIEASFKDGSNKVIAIAPLKEIVHHFKKQPIAICVIIDEHSSYYIAPQTLQAWHKENQILRYGYSFTDSAVHITQWPTDF